MYKVAFKNLGCKVNSYEVEKMRDKIPQNFYEVDFKDVADVYIINTCSVTHVADKKSRQMIHQAMNRNKKALIVACGCFVNSEKLHKKNIDNKNNYFGKRSIENENESNINNFNNNFTKNQENVIYIDNENKESVWKVINENVSIVDNNRTIVDKIIKCFSNFSCIDKKNNEIKKSLDIDEKVRGFLKIEDGCNNFCSYCLIPYLRGRIKSRKLEDILYDAKQMVKNGKKEIVLTGIDINAYGEDFKNLNINKKLFDKFACNVENEARVSCNICVNNNIEKNKINKKNYKEIYTNYYLIEVIKAVCDIDGVLRVRIGSLHPKIVTNDFIKNLVYNKKLNNGNINKFCPEFHLSLQSGSDNVLKKMNRKYTTKDYEKAVNIIRKYFKNATITTDIIVGFPEETDKDFKDTCNFVKKIKFYNPHIFKYSIREGTIASKMIQVADNIKEKREKILIKLCDDISNNIRKKQTGKTKEVLVEEVLKDENKAIGFTKEYMKVKIDLSNKRKDIIDNIVGKIVEVKLI